MKQVVACDSPALRERYRPMRILIVDDDADISEAMRIVLENRGFTVDTARDSKEAAGQVGSQKPDLIILDVMLPQRDGFQVCKNLRNSGVSTPILMLTARSTTLDTVTGLRSGADDYLRKPFEIRELIASIEQVVAQH